MKQSTVTFRTVSLAILCMVLFTSFSWAGVIKNRSTRGGVKPGYPLEKMDPVDACLFICNACYEVSQYISFLNIYLFLLQGAYLWIKGNVLWKVSIELKKYAYYIKLLYSVSYDEHLLSASLTLWLSIFYKTKKGIPTSGGSRISLREPIPEGVH